MIIHKETEFNIGDSVYHITPESDMGIILDISYSVHYKLTKYYVTFGRDSYDWFTEEELTRDKRFAK